MKSLQKLILSALMAALCCIATMVIQIPSPTGGYCHLGDGFVILSGVLLGPFYGFLSASIGSMLADLLSGYVAWAIATFLIKGIAAFAVGFIYSKIKKNYAVILGGLFCCFIVTIGYLLFEAFIMGNGLAATFIGVPSNLVQGSFGIVIATLIYPLIKKVPQIRDMIS